MAGDDRRAQELRGLEERYERVRSALPAGEREEVEAKKHQPASAGYGHDLVSAIARGWRKKAKAAIREAMRCMSLAGNYGRTDQPERSPTLRFANALDALIRVGAEEGCTADDMREAMQREIDCDDSCSLEAVVRDAEAGRPR